MNSFSLRDDCIPAVVLRSTAYIPVGVPEGEGVTGEVFTWVLLFYDQ